MSQSEIKIGYKVVAKMASGKLYSYGTSCWYFKSEMQYLRDLCVLEYKVGEWVEPKISGTNLYCFAKIEDAFQLNIPNLCPMYKCEYVESDKSVNTMQFEEDSMEFLDSLLKDEYQNKKYQQSYIRGTVAASKIKLLEKVR